MPENELAYEIYNAVGSSFVVNAGLQQKVFDSYRDELSEMSGHGIRFLFRKMELVHGIAQDFYKGKR